jgi:hypothetical protein
LAYGFAAFCISTIPRRGNKAKGTNAVTATGTASVAHHTAIRINRAAVLCPSGDNPSGVGRIKTKKAENIPNVNPILFFRNLIISRF